MASMETPRSEGGKSGSTLGEFFAEIEASGGPTLSAEAHRSLTAEIRARRGTLPLDGVV